MSLIVEHINKSFAHVQAIKDLSMEVQEGAIFGFLGGQWRWQNHDHAHDSGYSAA